MKGVIDLTFAQMLVAYAFVIVLPLFVVIITGAVLVYGTLDLPPFGAADNPVHTHVTPA